MYIGCLNYYETGCGIRIILKTGKTVEDIKKDIDDYFLIGLSIMSIEDVKTAIKNEEMTNEIKVLMMTLEHYCPISYANFVKYKVIDLNFEYSLNLS